MTKKSLKEYFAELLGTFILVFFGVGSVHVAVLYGGLVGLGQVSLVWGMGVMLAIYATGAISGAHLNPAMTIAFATYRGFPLKKVVPYILSQVLGAFFAAAVLYFIFKNSISDYEVVKNIIRGQKGSELSAMMFGEYFPNPAIVGVIPSALAKVSCMQAMFAEGFGTGLLTFLVFVITCSRTKEKTNRIFTALLIGLSVAVIICILAPLTQAGLNPARDFGPRLFSYFLGWGEIAIPGPRGGFFTVYILSPIIGALIGGAIHQFLIRPKEVCNCTSGIE